MKRQSNYLFTILLFVMILGCSKEEDPGVDDIGMILGEWEGYERTLVFKDGTEETLSNDNCEGHILEFFEDGRLFWVDFISENQSCVENQETKPIGEWERISNGKYVFTLQNAADDSEIGIVPELIEFRSNSSSSIMNIRYAELPENSPDDAAYFYLTLFKR